MNRSFMAAIKVYHFHNGSGGGVLSVIKNIVKFSTDAGIENHIIYCINKKQKKYYDPESIVGIASQQVFYYHPKSNFYYTCRQLAALLPAGNAIIAAHDWLELGMAGNLGLPNAVVHFVHGDSNYYYELTKKSEAAADAVICISPVIFRSVKKILPAAFSHNLKFPVPEIPKKNTAGDILKLFFFVRDLHEKGKRFDVVLKIAELLRNEEGVFFTIAGAGFSVEEFNKIWPGGEKKNVTFLGSQSNTQILQQLQQQDIFLLPSVSEGLPVSLVEAMKAGLVPLVTNWKNATEDLLTDAVNGFYIEAGNAEKYAERILFLKQNRDVLREFSDKASASANEMFDPYKNTLLIENVYRQALQNVKIKHPKKIYGSRLDNPIIPNFVVRMLRLVLKK